MKPQDDANGKMDLSMTESNQIELVNMAHQLVCLRNVANLLSDNNQPLNDILTTFVHLIPEAWQYPGITCVRVSIGQDIITSVNFSESNWKLSVPIKISMTEIGKLEVFYLEEKPNRFDGPFLRGESVMLETLAVELSHFVERRELLQLQQRQHRELELYSSLLRHDIKNDLGVILANVDLARMINRNPDKDYTEIYNSTEFACGRMMDLLNAFSRTNSGIDNCLTKIIKKVSLSAQEIHTGLTINLINNKDTESLMVPSSNLLPLVFENILRNAAIHAGEDCTVIIELTKSENTVRIRISDNGKGIASEVREKLFQKGVSTRGGGLGLYLSKQVVETMGGTIELAPSRDGEGAVFLICLPLVVIANGVCQYDKE